jgi:dTDP-4-dehydrorhamnose 3,5-epimerase
VDMRRSSPTYGRWSGHRLSADNHKQLWLPPGMAHAFMVLSPQADVLYKATDYYAPQHERSIRWDDPDLGIDWPLDQVSRISEKDDRGVAFRDAESYA